MRNRFVQQIVAQYSGFIFIVVGNPCPYLDGLLPASFVLEQEGISVAIINIIACLVSCRAFPFGKWLPDAPSLPCFLQVYDSVGVVSLNFDKCMKRFGFHLL